MYFFKFNPMVYTTVHIVFLRVPVFPTLRQSSPFLNNILLPLSGGKGLFSKFPTELLYLFVFSFTFLPN